MVYAKRPFAGPKAVLAYLARYTHRVAISNSRLIALDQAAVTFKWKDYRIKGPDRLSTMTLDADPKIPIGRAAPNQTAPFPTRGFLLTRLSDAGQVENPAAAYRRLQIPHI